MQGYKKRTLKFENKKNHSSFPEQFLNCVPSVSYKGFPSGAIERKNVLPDVCPDCDVSAIALQ